MDKDKTLTLDQLPPLTKETMQRVISTAPVRSTVTRKRIGEEIAAIRQARGMTQADLAARCGVNQARIAHVERGDNSTGIDLLAHIADTLGYNIELKKKTKKQ